MKCKKSLTRSALLLCCSALIPTAAALDDRDSRLLLNLVGGSLSADIRKEPLAKVARALEMKTGARFHFQASQVKEQEITARFEHLALEAALRTILKKTSYAMVAEQTEQGVGIRVYVYSELPEGASTQALAAGEIDMAGQALVPTEVPVPPDVFDPDPAVRARELEGFVASYGPQSLSVVLAAAQDQDSLLRSTSVNLLLNDLRDVVPREDLTTIAQRSERPEIRLQALEALAERKDWLDHAQMTLDGALHDTDPQVQQRAEELLLELSK